MSLPDLPRPTVIQPIDFQGERDTRLEALTELMRNNNEGNTPDFSYPLPSDPSYQVISTSAYRDQLRVQQMNEAILSNLLLFAKGSDLDNLAITPPFNVERLDKGLKTEETDDRFRERVQLRIRGWTPGTFDYYEYQARSASTEIRDIALSLTSNKVIKMTVMSNSETGEPSEKALTTIQRAVNASNIKLNNDTLDVQPVKLVPITLEVTLYLRPDALPGIDVQLLQEFQEVFNKARGIGWDVACSWINAQHHVTGVKRVEINLDKDIVIKADECAYLKSYNVESRGEEW